MLQRLKTGIRTNANDVKLETTLQQLLLNLRSNAVETDMALGDDGRSWRSHFVCRWWAGVCRRVLRKGRVRELMQWRVNEVLCYPKKRLKAQLNATARIGRLTSEVKWRAPDGRLNEIWGQWPFTRLEKG